MMSNDLFRIVTIAKVPEDGRDGGKLMVSEAPGKKDRHNCRSLEDDLHSIKAHDIKAIVCLLTWSELEKAKIKGYPQAAQDQGITFYHFPILPGKIPQFDDVFVITSRIIKHLTAGENVLVHCYQGLGRAGMICACCLSHYRYGSEKAIREVRKRRQGAIENDSQEDCVRSYCSQIKRRCLRA